jgi:hypothetical protein
VYAFVAALQLSALQTLPAAYFWQSPAPLQRPLFPQDATPSSRQTRAGSRSPAAARGSG